MIKKLLYKLFGLSPDSCLTCEILRDQLEKSEVERRNLIARLLDREKPELPAQQTEEFKPIQPQYVPWKVRQQMLESEDRKAAQLMKDRKREIADLEKELGVATDVPRAASGGVIAEVK